MSHERIGSRLSWTLNDLDALPAMPEIAHRLLALQLDTEEGETQMLCLIEQDPQLSARIIGLANSSATGVKHGINSIRDAALLLGLKRLKSVAIGMATLSKLAKQPTTKNFDPHDLWSHSITVAIVMNLLAQAMPEATRPDENQTFLAGLLHDIGLMALYHLDHEASDELHHQLRIQPKRSIGEIETELFGITHSHIGAQLVRHWNLPAEIIEVVALHHAPRSENNASPAVLAKMVNIAERLLPDFGIAEHPDHTISDDDWREIGIDPARSNELAALANEVAMQVIQLPDSHAKPHGTPGAAARHAIHPLVDAARYSSVLAPAKALAGWVRKILRW